MSDGGISRVMPSIAEEGGGGEAITAAAFVGALLMDSCSLTAGGPGAIVEAHGMVLEEERDTEVQQMAFFFLLSLLSSS